MSEIRDSKLLKYFENMVRLQLLQYFLFLALFCLRNYNHCENDATTLNNFSGNLAI